MCVVAGNAPRRDRLELVVGVAAGDDEGRVELFEDVAVALQQQGAELGDVVGDEVEVEPVAQLRDFKRAGAHLESDDLADGEDVDASQVEVRVR
jgi:hypothetical protein